MTRESRLAVVVGFSLVLVVGVLVSDHLSRAREAESDPGLTAVEARLFEDTSPLPDPPATRIAASSASSMLGRRNDDVRSVPEAPPVQNPIDLAAQQDDRTRLDLGDEQIASADDSGPLEYTIGGSNSDQPASGLGGLFRQPTPTAVLDKPASTPRYHHVQEGETLFNIAEAYLGSGHQWRDIRDANPDRVREDGSVRIGVRLLIPVAGRIPDNFFPVEQPRSNPNNQPRTGTYVIQKGDVLSVLAQQFCGSARKMDMLLDLNKDVISDADDIRVGMTIRVPVTGD
ncbi:MAG: LysM peptidoglycan-binding domain-containing protein [Planctomycetota bacterium]